jgi:hypothetical protein
LTNVELVRRRSEGAKLFHGSRVDIAGHDGVAAGKQRARKTKAEAAGSASDEVMFHAEDDSHEQGAQQSTLNVQPLIHRKGREERKGN